MPITNKPSSLNGLRPEPSLRVTKSDRMRTAILNAALDIVWSRPFHEMTVSSLMD